MSKFLRVKYIPLTFVSQTRITNETKTQIQIRRVVPREDLKKARENNRRKEIRFLRPVLRS